MTEDDLRELAERGDPLARALLRLDEDVPPPDVVPPRRLTDEERAERDALLESMRGHDIEIHEPGRPIYGPDGEWIGMTEPTITTAYLPSREDYERD